MREELSPVVPGGAQLALPGRDVALWTDADGDGPPLLLLGGMGAHLGHWRRSFLDGFPGRRLIRFEPRGVNRSSVARRPFGIVEQADDAAALLALLEVERTDVLGFSMGGMVAQELALRHPGVVDRLVLVGSAAGGAPAPIPDPVWQAMWAALRGGDADAAIQATWALSVSPDFLDDDSLIEWRAAARAGGTRPRVVSWQHDAVQQHDAADRLATLGARSTVVHGTADAVIPPDRAERLAAALGSRPVHWLEGVGHACCWEASEQTAAMAHEALAGPA